jgi:hypothetical protein
MKLTFTILDDTFLDAEEEMTFNISDISRIMADDEKDRTIIRFKDGSRSVAKINYKVLNGLLGVK